MSFSITLSKNDISADIASKIGKAQSPKMNRDIGNGVVGLAKESFNDASKRPAPWKAKSDGSASTLKSREATLWRSLRVVSTTKTSVRIGSDRVYAAIHQFGGTIRPKKAGGRLVFTVGGKKVFAKSVTIPARPYFPVINGQLTPLAQQRIKDIIEKHLKG